MNIEKLIPYINYLKEDNVDKEVAIDLLRREDPLDLSEKRLIYMYCYPRPLGDRELPSRVIGTRRNRGPYARNGFLNPDDLETALIIEAGQTIQYGRFIKHLMHSFTDPEKICQISGTDVLECPICGKKIREVNIWDPTLDKTREHLAYGSPTETSLVLCLDCLVQLNCASEIMNVLDPGFLDWTKRNHIKTH